MRAPWRIPDAERAGAAKFALSFATLIVAWACLHDLHLVGIEPRHFTEYHRPLLPLHDHRLLAVQYAIVATLGPGIAFGFLAWAACRAGRKPPRNLGPVLGGFLALITAVEIALIAVGRWADHRADAGLPPLYPAGLYPDLTRGILCTQTINLTAYWLAPACGALYLLAIRRTRRGGARAQDRD
ncbi:MAG TPA: hypothetical protein VIO38_14285 [Rariglobus sp.]